MHAHCLTQFHLERMRCVDADLSAWSAWLPHAVLTALVDTDVADTPAIRNLAINLPQ